MAQPDDVAPATDDGVDMTIDQIAQHAGIPASTVRLYQNKGLLPPPERRGRVGYYGAGHRDRLRLIAHLQQRGFSLAAIKEALNSWNAGRSLDHLLGVSDIAPSLGREPLRLSPLELAQRFEGVDLTQARHPTRRRSWARRARRRRGRHLQRGLRRDRSGRCQTRRSCR